MDAHACCRKPAVDETAPVPASPTNEGGEDAPSPDCAKWTLYLTLAKLAAEPQDLFLKAAGAEGEKTLVASPFAAGFHALAIEAAMVAEMHGPPGSGSSSPRAVVSLAPLRI